MNLPPKAVDQKARKAADDDDAVLARLNRRVQALEESLETIRAAGENFWRKEAAAYFLATGRDSWTYSAEYPKPLTQDTFPPEFSDGKAKRWVTGVGFVEATLPISRLVPLAFEADVPAFVTPAVAETLALTIDDRPVEWRTRNIDGIWTARIPERANTYTLKFKLAVRTDLIPKGTDASFAIRLLSIFPA